MAERDAKHSDELDRVKRDHSAALRAAAESDEAASAALRADLAEEREALFAERDAAVEKNRKYYQARRQYPKSLERIYELYSQKY